MMHIIFLSSILIAILAANTSAAPTHGHAIVPAADQCDWTGRGTVSWRYPRGALRVVLSGGSDGRSFRGCVKASGPARVYLEGKGTLRLVYAPGDGKHEALHRCFHSRGQLAALYVEADETTPTRGTVKLRYDLELEHVNNEGKKIRRDEETECRPCTKEELAETYCKSDLVARDLRLQREVRVRLPTVCDARHGQGEFVIMAKKRLGDLTLACAPRLEVWAEAVRELQSAPCFLKS
ncbi:hypothetical protein G9C98_000114 [Cotesia typhae]|uniref:Meteorin-like protein n=1 Tax=Cotesia typhae TaxID=2053667 RepID=A0A8J5VCK2_9HYME|nr:hypothetical protein G9C98_000114 [Cotesia typhae]